MHSACTATIRADRLQQFVAFPECHGVEGSHSGQSTAVAQFFGVRV